MGSLPIFSHRVAVAIFATLTLLVLTGSTRAAALGLEGRVVVNQSPVSEARVYAYQLVEKSLHKVLTDGSGRFLFDALPAGIYKLIAHKAGLQPVIRLLQRDAAEASQFVELRMTEEAASDPTDFWSVRSEIPSDVLREITSPLGSEAADGSGLPGTAGTTDLVLVGTSALDSGSQAEVSALSGVQDVKPNASARLTGANVGFLGQLGKVKLAMQGDFQTLESELSARTGGDAGLDIDGQTHLVSFNLQTPAQGEFNLSSSSNRLTMTDQSFASPVLASELYFGWNRALGEKGSTSIKASLVEENGLYNRAWIDPLGVPTSSRTLRLEGNYARKFENFGDLRSGLRYRESTGAYARRLTSTGSALLEAQSLDAYSDGAWQAHEKVLVQYGLFSTMTDGSISVTPRGGFVLMMGALWQTSLTAAHRVVSQNELANDNLLPIVLDGSMTCGEAEAACYQVAVERTSGVDSQLEIGASYRELDKTVRMYFNNNFFESSEGIFLVPGDRMPEVHASVTQRIAPGVVAKVSASVSSGGGGVFQSVNRRYYENEVSMLSSGIDATFERTSTGVFLSFHRLDQHLERYSRSSSKNDLGPASDLQRLDLIVSQNLSAIWDLTQDWAVNLSMGLARGASFFHSDVASEAVQRRVVTSVAVRF